jgi:hypothetical protein
LLLESEAMRPHLGELVQDAFYYRWTHPDPRMDRLHTEIGAAVARAADRKEDAEATFARIVGLADSAAGVESEPVEVAHNPDGRRPPRLTEPWFC